MATDLKKKHLDPMVGSALGYAMGKLAFEYLKREVYAQS